jgi:hypothetical protein
MHVPIHPLAPPAPATYHLLQRRRISVAPVSLQAQNWLHPVLSVAVLPTLIFACRLACLSFFLSCCLFCLLVILSHPFMVCLLAFCQSVTVHPTCLFCCCRAYVPVCRPAVLLVSLSVIPLVCLSVNLSFCLLLSLPYCQSVVRCLAWLYFCVSICMLPSLSACLSSCPSVFLPVILAVFLSLGLSNFNTESKQFNFFHNFFLLLGIGTFEHLKVKKQNRIYFLSHRNVISLQLGFWENKTELFRTTYFEIFLLVRDVCLCSKLLQYQHITFVFLEMFSINEHKTFYKPKFCSIQSKYYH